MRIATFNVQNLRLRRDRGGGDRLDGARDRDVPADRDPQAGQFDQIDRRLTAAVLRDADADVVALQEVFDQATLDHFHDRYLIAAGCAPYAFRFCRPGNDGQGLDVALMSRRPVDEVATHATLTAADLGLDAEAEGVLPPGQPVFRRDCLMAQVGGVTLFVCHFKAPYPETGAVWAVRRLEALAVRRLIERRFFRPDEARWLVLGDLNEPVTSPPGHDRAIAPLLDGFAVDLMDRVPAVDRWTYLDPKSRRYSRPDALLASPALARACPGAVPVLIREGLGREVERYPGPRLGGVGRHRPHASDHAAVVIDLAGL